MRARLQLEEFFSQLAGVDGEGAVRGRAGGGCEGEEIVKGGGSGGFFKGKSGGGLVAVGLAVGAAWPAGRGGWDGRWETGDGGDVFVEGGEEAGAGGWGSGRHCGCGGF